MVEGEISGISRYENADDTGWVTTDVAARALRVAPRTVRAYIEQGRLKGKAQGKGVRKSWLVSIDSVQSLRAERMAAGDMPSAMPRDTAADYTAGLPDTIRDMAQRLEARAAEAEGLKVRLELTEKAESTVREERDRLLSDLEKEREERRQSQEEANRLRVELEAERSKGVWRRLFGR